MTKINTLAVALALLLCFGAGAGKCDIIKYTLNEDDVSRIKSPKGDMVIFRWTAPPTFAGRNVDDARLIVYVDAEVVSETYSGEAVLDVWFLSGEFEGSGVPPDAREWRTSHFVTPGTGREIRIDIRRYVREWLRDPSGNHGLAIGALGGNNPSRFTFREDPLDATSVGAVEVFSHAVRP